MEYGWEEKEVYILTAFNNLGCKPEEYHAETIEEAEKLKGYLLNSGAGYITRVEISDKKEMRKVRYAR